MSEILVDTNVLLDVATDDATWADWSQRQLETWALKGSLVINAIIYAELSIGFERVEELEAVLSGVFSDPRSDRPTNLREAPVTGRRTRSRAGTRRVTGCRTPSWARGSTTSSSRGK